MLCVCYVVLENGQGYLSVLIPLGAVLDRLDLSLMLLFAG